MARFVPKEQIEQLSIVDFLARLGYHPHHKSGQEYFYHSMLRDDDSYPSFSVKDSEGRWMDRGKADPDKRGGGIIQLAAILWPHLSFVETLNEIDRVANGAVSLPDQVYIPHKRDEPDPNQEYRFALTEVKPIGTYEPLTSYVKARGLLEVAQGNLVEVYYRDREKPNTKLPYFAFGWLNEHGNYEIANPFGFKSSIGKKGISIVPGSPEKVQVFESYFDYLSRSRYYPEPEGEPTVIVLNAVNMLKFALDTLKKFPEIDVYTDRDKAGQKCFEVLQSLIPHAKDRSCEYEGFKDYNEKLQHSLGLVNAHLSIYTPKHIGR